MRLRQSVRALILDPQDHVLLVRFHWEGLEITDGFWANPGGGIEPGETRLDAMQRELCEETGLIVDSLGTEVWTKTALFPMTRWDGQVDHIHLHRGKRFDLSWWTGCDKMAFLHSQSSSAASDAHSKTDDLHGSHWFRQGNPPAWNPSCLNLDAGSRTQRAALDPAPRVRSRVLVRKTVRSRESARKPPPYVSTRRHTSPQATSIVVGTVEATRADLVAIRAAIPARRGVPPHATG